MPFIVVGKLSKQVNISYLKLQLPKNEGLKPKSKKVQIACETVEKVQILHFPEIIVQ
jgi:hypothetical protein